MKGRWEPRLCSFRVWPSFTFTFYPADNVSSGGLEVKRKIIGIVLCSIVYDKCPQWYSCTYEQFLQITVGLGLGLIFIFFYISY